MTKRMTGKAFIEQFRSIGYRKGQIRKLFFLSQHVFRLDLENIIIVLNTDAKWIERRNRTPLERMAEKIGHSVGFTAGREYQYVIWAYPSISVAIHPLNEEQQKMKSRAGCQRNNLLRSIRENKTQ